jgi:hypothetical protein
VNITIQVTGLDELIKKVNDPALIGEPMRGFFNKSTVTIQRNVQLLTPVDQGRLYSSITTEVDLSPMPQYGKVGTNLQPHYAPDVEFGTRPHWPPISAIQGWANRHGIPVFLVARKIARYGTKGKFMFRDGAKRSMGDIGIFLANAASEIESRWGRK